MQNAQLAACLNVGNFNYLIKLKTKVKPFLWNIYLKIENSNK